MSKRSGPWRLIFFGGLSLAALLLVHVPTIGAQPDPLQSFIYLPLIVKPVPPPSANPFNLEIWVGPDCDGTPVYNGPSPAVVSGPVTHINASTDVFNAVNSSIHFDWQLNGSFPSGNYFSGDATFGDIRSVDSGFYSSLPPPCQGQLDSGTYHFQLVVDNQVMQSGTVTVQ
jgi:hypothetical protein